MLFSRLNAKNYLESVGDSTKISTNILLTPHRWLAEAVFGPSLDFRTWDANGALVARGLSLGSQTVDVIVCLPGASMALVTLEEAISSGAKKCVFLGTAAAINPELVSGKVLFDGDIASVLNPFEEQDEWTRLRGHEAVDMETEFLKRLCGKRGIPFHSALIIADHVSETTWSSLIVDEEYKKTLKKSLEDIRRWSSNL